MNMKMKMCQGNEWMRRGGNLEEFTCFPIEGHCQVLLESFLQIDSHSDPYFKWT